MYFVYIQIIWLLLTGILEGVHEFNSYDRSLTILQE